MWLIGEPGLGDPWDPETPIGDYWGLLGTFELERSPEDGTPYIFMLKPYGCRHINSTCSGPRIMGEIANFQGRDGRSGPQAPAAPQGLGARAVYSE